ncbi:uncharacterized protein [Eurosta solidaginis]|uniref:uncharacterized protein n=1 Tax=Eurosta solidaginis TaxID=178769 RepID=UPI0035305CBB
MDKGKLIDEVKKRRPLWDLENKRKVDKNLIIQLWEEISVELDWPTDDIKKKWANLRHTYRIALKKQWITWKYLDQMSFLPEGQVADPLSKKRSQFNESIEATTTFTENFEENNELDEFSEWLSPENSECNDPPPAKKRRQQPLHKNVERVEGNSTQENISEDKKKANHHFLLSFLPIMNEMTDIQRLEFRAQMSNLTLKIMRPKSRVNDEFIYDEASSSCFNREENVDTSNEF